MTSAVEVMRSVLRLVRQEFLPFRLKGPFTRTWKSLVMVHTSGVLSGGWMLETTRSCMGRNSGSNFGICPLWGGGSMVRNSTPARVQRLLSKVLLAHTFTGKSHTPLAT